MSDYSTELIASPDRILLECEWLYDADASDLYGFMIHVLDEENTVTTLSQGNTIDKETCSSRLKKIGKILSDSKYVYLEGIGNLENARVKGKKSYTFRKLGTFYSNERTLKFMSISNTHGGCYDAYSGDEKPCPREPFSSKHK